MPHRVAALKSCGVQRDILISALRKEKLLGLTKSFVAYSGWD